MVLILLGTFVSALNYEIVEENHNLIYHSIIYKISNNGLLPTDWDSELEISPIDFGFNVKEPKIERIEYSTREQEIPTYYRNCSSFIDDDGQEIPYCDLIQNGTRLSINSVKTYYNLPIIFDDVGLVKGISIQEPLEIGLGDSIFVKFSWKTDIMDVGDGFGTKGMANINPTIWWDDSYDYRKRINFTYSDHTYEPIVFILDDICDGNCRADYEDIRIYDFTEDDLVDYEFLNVTFGHTKGTLQQPTYLQAIFNQTFNEVYFYYGNNNATAVDTIVFNYTALFNGYEDFVYGFGQSLSGVQFIDDGRSLTGDFLIKLRVSFAIGEIEVCQQIVNFVQREGDFFG